LDKDNIFFVKIWYKFPIKIGTSYCKFTK